MKNCLFILGGILLVGCSTPEPKTPRPFTQQEQQLFFKGAKSPQVFGVTVYPSDTGPVFAGANRVHEGQWANMSFISKAPMIVLQPGGPGKFTALVDTSSKENWLNAFAAHQAHIVPIGPPAYTTKPEQVADEIGGYLCIAPKIRLNDMHVETALFYTRAAHGPLGAPARWSTDPEPDAVMGCNLLKSFAFVQFHFGQREIRFSATKSYTPNEAALIASIPMKEVNGALAVDGFIDGEPRTIIIDTVGDFAIAVKDVPAEPFRQVSIGDVVFRNVTASSSMDAGLGLLESPRIGRQLLSKFIVTLDFKTKKIHMERPANVVAPIKIDNKT